MNSPSTELSMSNPSWQVHVESGHFCAKVCQPAALRAALALAVITWMHSTVLGADAVGISELIDEHIQRRLDADGVKPAATADDAEFLRRVYLDLHGVIPSQEQTIQFLDATNPGKRAKLVDQLLNNPQFGVHFADIWRSRLISPLTNEQRVSPNRFGEWLAERFNRDNWDRIVYQLLTASGKVEENPAVIYLIEGRNPLGVTDLTDLSCRYFLGLRLNCARCHDHPFAKWTRTDYWGTAAFFAQIQTPGRPKLVHRIGVQDDLRMKLSSLQDTDMIDGFQLSSPIFLGGQKLDVDSAINYREAFARWVTSGDNPFFARAAVNRMWWHFFGRGIVDPVDDMHAGTKASHPELLDLLSQHFVESGFDLKQLCREILNSSAYQRTSRPGEQPQREAELFGRMSIKVLSAEQLYDSLVRVLGAPARSKTIDMRPGTREEFIQFFAADGDPEPTRYDRGIPHALRLMNSPQFASRNLAALASVVANPQRSTDEVINQLFITILSRRPTAAERKIVEEEMADQHNSLDTACRELAWALLTSSEFSLNH